VTSSAVAASKTAPRRPPKVKASVVIATYNRGPSLCDLLNDLNRQTLDPSSYEVVVNDDGSKPPADAVLRGLRTSYRLVKMRQNNAGPASARHKAIVKARGEVVIIIDDDMRVEQDFIESHLRAHKDGTDVVLGHILPAPDLEQMPIFERFHAQQLVGFVSAVTSGRTKVRGVHLCTGNMSVHRSLYLEVGGFDSGLLRSEDRELGIRLEKHGATLRFAHDAATRHCSNHADLAVWLGRALRYGVFDAQISRKHPDVEIADPWRFFFLINPVSRPLMLTVIAVPALGRTAARVVMEAARGLDGIGREDLAITATTLAYGIEYFRGVRQEYGTLRASLTGLWRHRGVRKGTRRHGEVEGAGKGGHMTKSSGRIGALRHFVHALREDYGSVQRNREKYHHQSIPLSRMPVHLLQKIGLQMSAAVRVMHLFRDAGVPLLPQVTCRLIRHLYGAEIHWNADIAPGISIVHGNGLVISHAATVGERCILFHNVTLGEGIDPKTREVGAPTLEADVHIGPGATLVGPITVGKGTKIMAGAVLAESVPPRSLVSPGSVQISRRASKSDGNAVVKVSAAKPVSTIASKKAANRKPTSKKPLSG